MHSIIITTVATTMRELQHHRHHNTTRVSTEKERKVGERIKVTKWREKKRIKKRNRECRKVGMHQ